MCVVYNALIPHFRSIEIFLFPIPGYIMSSAR